MTIKLYKQKGRHSIIARIRVGDGNYFDLSTGIKSPLDYDNKTQRFIDTDEGSALNNKLYVLRTGLEDDFKAFGEQQDSKGFKDYLEGGKIESVDGELTVRGILTTYQQMLDDGLILTKKNKPLSEGSLYNRDALMKRMLTLDDNVLDFDFSKYNDDTFGLKATKDRWAKFRVDFVKGLANKNLQEASIWCTVMQFKSTVKHMLRLNNVNAGMLLEDMTYSYNAKEVKVLTKDQYDFLMDNYNTIRSECEHYTDRVVLDYWMTALVLCMRIGSMRELTEHDIYYEDGKMNLSYQPRKTKDSSGLEVNTVVPPIIQKIFERNIENLGRPLPKVTKDFRTSKYIRRIAQKYDVFKNRIVAEVKEDGKMVKKTVFAWTQLTMHMGRATGITEYLEKGVPEAVVKTISAHTVNSTAFPRYVNVRKKTADEHMERIWG